MDFPDLRDTSPAPPTHQPRGKGGALKIVEAAERLFGRDGIDAISLRQITQEAGLSNPNLVQYHFGSKEGLVHAIWQLRLPLIDLERSMLVAQAEGGANGGELDIHALLVCVFTPFFSPRFAAFTTFLRQVLRLPRDIALRMEAVQLTPQTTYILEQVRAKLPTYDGKMFDLRMRLATIVVLEAVTLGREIGAGTPEEVRSLALDAAFGCLNKRSEKN